MPRQRMVKPDFFDSGSLAECSHSARLAFIGLWVMGDDKGNVKLSVKKLRRQIFPFDEVTDEDFAGYLAELEKVGCIKAYEVDGEEYITTVNFSVYQTVKNPSKTTIPEPPESLAKRKRTTRFSKTNPVLTQDYATTVSAGDNTSVIVAQEGDYPSPDPALTHDRLPINKVSKEEDIFPKEKISSPSAVAAVAVRTAPPAEDSSRAPHCPMCDGLLKMDVKAGGWSCECIGVVKPESVVWR